VAAGAVLRGSVVTFEVTLFESGQIGFQYLDVESGPFSHGRSATIGVKSTSGLSGLQIASDGPSVANGLAFQIRQGPPVPRCGLIGIELLLVAPFCWRRKRSRVRRAAARQKGDVPFPSLLDK
jgi:hypothetical protein